MGWMVGIIAGWPPWTFRIELRPYGPGASRASRRFAKAATVVEVKHAERDKALARAALRGRLSPHLLKDVGAGD
jgi:hypothetical protein